MDINEYTGMPTFDMQEYMDAEQKRAASDIAQLQSVTDPNLVLEATQYLNQERSATASIQYAESKIDPKAITDHNTALQYARYLNDYKGPKESTEFMESFMREHPVQSNELSTAPVADQQLYDARMQYNQLQQPKITYGGFEEDKLKPSLTTPIQEGLNSARQVTGAVFPSLKDNIYENRAALRETLNQSNLNMQDAYRKGDMEMVRSITAFVEAATNALNAISYGTNNSKMYGNELGVNTPRRGAMEPVRPGDSQVRDLSRVEANIIAADPRRANNLSNFRTFRKLLENDNRYNLTKPQLAYLLATVDYQTGGTFSADSEEPMPLGINDPQDIVAQNLRASGFHGRGYAGLRGKDLYIGLSQVVGQDLVSNPGRLANPQVSYNVLIEGVMNGLFTGKRLDDYINPQKTDFYNARNIMSVDHNGAKDIMVLANRYLEEL